LKDGIALDGFPGTGLLNAIASECLIRTSGTELFAVIDSPEFPPLSIISNSIPHFPARLHVKEGLKVAFFISEFNIDPPMQSTMGKKILDWSMQNGCRNSHYVPYTYFPAQTSALRRYSCCHYCFHTLSLRQMKRMLFVPVTSLFLLALSTFLQTVLQALTRILCSTFYAEK
jgi:hypothetical protein